MSKSDYLRCKSLHSLPKFASKLQRIQVGNGQYGSVLFIISIVIGVHGHRLQIFTLVSQIHENVDLVLEIKNLFQLGGVMNSWESSFSLLARLIPFSPKGQVILKPREQWFIKIEAPFIDKISGLAIVKMLEKIAHNTMMLKLKFVWNLTNLDVNNISLETVIFDPKEMLDIFDLRSIRYYKIIR